MHRHEVLINAPNGGYMRQAPGTGTRHLPGMWNVSFVGNQFLEPARVSLHNIEFMEGEVFRWAQHLTAVQAPFLDHAWVAFDE